MSRRSISLQRAAYSQPTVGEVMVAVFILIGTLVAYGAILFAIDAIAAQLVLFVLASFHITAGFWQAFGLVVVTAFVVSIGAYGGSRIGSK